MKNLASHGSDRSMLTRMQNSPIRVKVFAASLVLVICLVALGGHAYLMAGRSADDLNALTSRNLPKRQSISDLNDEVIATHVMVFRFVTWASNGVNPKLLKSLSDDIAAHLTAVTARLRQ